MNLLHIVTRQSLNGFQRLLFLLVLVVFQSIIHAQELCSPSISLDDGGVAIKDYLVIGPFRYAEEGNFDDVDYLQSFGLKERTAKKEVFDERLTAELNIFDHAALREKAILSKDAHLIDFDYLFKHTFSKEKADLKAKSAAYVVFSIKSKQAAPAWLQIGCAGLVKVALNGKYVYIADEKARRFSIYAKTLKVPLQEGENFIIAKVGRSVDLWGFCASVSACESDAFRFALSGQASLEKYLLPKNVFAQNTETISLQPQGISIEQPINGHVLTLAGEKAALVSGKSIQWMEGYPKPDLYKLHVSAEDAVYYERFLAGLPVIR